MAQLLRPGQVRVITKDGECVVAITLELTINLNDNGVRATVVEKEEVVEKPKETPWEIPDFTSSPKINFGRNE